MPLLGYSINYKKLSPYMVIQATKLSACFINTQVDSKHWYQNPENHENHIFFLNLNLISKRPITWKETSTGDTLTLFSR